MPIVEGSRHHWAASLAAYLAGQNLGCDKSSAVETAWRTLEYGDPSGQDREEALRLVDEIGRHRWSRVEFGPAIRQKALDNLTRRLAEKKK